MTATESTTRYLDALQTASEAALEGLKAAREERARFADRLYGEIETAQRRTLEVARRIVEQPTDFAGNWVALLDAQAQAQAQTLDLTRAWWEGFTGARAERRARFEKVWSANREAVNAGVAASREALAANPVAEMLRNNPVTEFFRSAAPAANGATAK